MLVCSCIYGTLFAQLKICKTKVSGIIAIHNWLDRIIAEESTLLSKIIRKEVEVGSRTLSWLLEGIEEI